MEQLRLDWRLFSRHKKKRINSASQVEQLIQNGREFHFQENRDLDKAIDFYLQALQGVSFLSMERQSDLHLYLAEAYRSLSFPLEVILAEYKLAFQLNEYSYSVLFGMGTFFLTELSDFEFSKFCFNRMIDLQPLKPYGVYWQGYCYELEGEYSKAVQSYQEALIIQSDYLPASQRLEKIKQYDKS